MIGRGARVGVVALAWGFAGCGGVQGFLAGMGLFDSAARWAEHAAFGQGIAPVPLGILVLAAVGRLPWRLLVLAVLVFVLYGLQYAFVNAGTGAVAALHPVNALALFWLSLRLGRGALSVTVAAAGGAAPRPAIAGQQTGG